MIEMTMNPKVDLEGVNTWIKFVSKEKTEGRWCYWKHRLACPYMWRVSTDEWLELLEFNKKQLEEEIKFKKELKIKYNR